MCSEVIGVGNGKEEHCGSCARAPRSELAEGWSWVDGGVSLGDQGNVCGPCVGTFLSSVGYVADGVIRATNTEGEAVKNPMSCLDLSALDLSAYT